MPASPPPELTSFVGRAEELAAIEPAVTAGRLLTLVGPGGCGKTRLAIRVARAAADSCWVGLEALDGSGENDPDPERVGRRAAEALEVLVPAGFDPVPAVVAALRDRELTIVLDNCEHVLDGAARLAAAILAGCPGVAVLATSRAPLGAAGERVWRVPPLSLADALALFLERSRIGDSAGARRLCDRLDRLPLALELAAGWAGTLSVSQIADSLGSPFTLLEGGARTAPFRQQTLEGSMRWSHDLLDEDERVLFRRLAVYEPGFGAGAVLVEPHGLRALRGLVDKSLVVADTTGSEATYRMLGVVRAYAMDRLTEAGEMTGIRDRHLDLHLDLVEQLAPTLTTDKDEWRARVGAAYPNIRAAIEWGLSQPDPSRGRRLAVACAWLWHLEGRGGEGVRLLRRAADRGANERTPLQADVLAAFALVADTGLPGMEAYQVAHAARELAVEAGAPAAARISRALTAVGHLMVGLDAALDEARAARAEALAAGDLFVADSAEALIGLIHVLADRYPEAIGHLEAAVAGPIARGDRGVAALALCWLALATARAGDLRRAGELAERAVETAAPLRDFHWTGSTRCVLAEIRVLQGRVAEAERALAPIESLLAGDLPFITGWERTKAMLALAGGRPAEAVRWCRLEGRWQPAPSDEGLAPETRLVLAGALRLAGEHEAAGRTLAALESAPLTPAMPRIRAGVVDEWALLVHDSDPERALRLHHEALRIRMDHDLVLGYLASLEALAELHRRRGAAELAGMLTGAAERAREDAGAAPRSRPEGTASALPADALDRGREMEVRAAVAYAAKARGPRRRPDAGWESLTPAEVSVVELAVQGLSNVEIGARLFIGRGTVKTHLAHVYAKLQVANRTELARLATERRDAAG
ncbi:LuxR C-terminal-related transcriptional regulator [Actinoplanes sp. KI2]|uniref:helix-turn-helix transcriptional regulator n=1 Tax=Actinoplanes sp. KI2 TaxID=2983315 RepID=UPI0021D5A803|nr:LuxR C-terminal-related transcriptional regulator [Actinoplanes sp. KI2]MCU7725073.1 LuxR C-terminal-related transcriptional regulator [Actinoplanes sp. KI2]